MQHVRRTLWLLPCPFLVACDPVFHSESGAWSFTQDQLEVTPLGFDNDAQAVLAGSVVCPETPGEDTGTDQLLWDCHAHTVTGGEVLTDSEEGPHCLRLDGPDTATWEWSAGTCDAVEDGYVPVPDRVVFTLADPASVTAEIQPWADELARDWMETTDGAAWPDDVIPAAGDPWRIVAGQEVYLYVALHDPITGWWTAWTRSAGALSADVLAGDADVTVTPGSGDLVVTLQEGAEVELSLTVGEDTWTSTTRLLGVSGDEAASLEVWPAYSVDAEIPTVRVPYAARAVVRDAAGNLLFGAPVDWSVRGGELAVVPGPLLDDEEWYHLPGPDYAYVQDECRRPSERVGETTARLQARYNGLEASADLTWTAMDDAWLAANCDGDTEACLEARDEGFEAFDECTGSCGGCSSRGGAGSAAWGALALAMGAATRRRRHGGQ